MVISKDEALQALGEPLVIERVLKAPRTTVWKAWTDPGILSSWWGPEGFTNPVVRIDLREGGSLVLCMRSPDGKDYWHTGIYSEIVPPKRLVLSVSFTDDKGKVVPATYYGMSPDIALQMLQAVSFAETEEGRTKVTVEHFGMPPGKDQENGRQGWIQSFDRLERVLAGLRDRP
jgi:uncharacterized protein YndB with AHSA1/START domain